MAATDRGRRGNRQHIHALHRTRMRRRQKSLARTSLMSWNKGERQPWGCVLPTEAKAEPLSSPTQMREVVGEAVALIFGQK